MVAAADTLIYIRMKDRQPDCWAPAGAVQISDTIYRVTSIVDDDALEFGIGARVRCENRCFPDGSEAIVAVVPAEPN